MKTQQVDKYLDPELLRRKLKEVHDLLNIRNVTFKITTKRGMTSWEYPDNGRELTASMSEVMPAHEAVRKYKIRRETFTRPRWLSTKFEALEATMDDLSSQLLVLSNRSCFQKDAFTNPIKVWSLSPNSSGRYNMQEQEISDSQSVVSLSGTVSGSTASDYAVRLICIYQDHSYRPLNISKVVFRSIIQEHSIGSEVLDLVSSFYQKTINVEEACCMPFQYYEDTEKLEYMYIFKYPEEQLARRQDEPWSIRQTAVYHQIRRHDRRSTIILFCPHDGSVGLTRIVDMLRQIETPVQYLNKITDMNRQLVRAYVSNWRTYLRHYDEEISRLTIRMLTIGIKSIGTVTADDMADLSFVESRLQPAEALLNALDRTLEGLRQFHERWARLDSGIDQCSLAMGPQHIVNMRNSVVAYRQYADTLLKKCHGAFQTLNGVLGVNSELISRRQADRVEYLTTSTVDDSATVKVVTVITLIFLSFTAMAAIFSMPLFYLDDGSKRLDISPSFWIYVLCALLLTAGTLLYWRFELQKRRRQREKRLKKLQEV